MSTLGRRVALMSIAMGLFLALGVRPLCAQEAPATAPCAVAPTDVAALVSGAQDDATEAPPLCGLGAQVSFESAPAVGARAGYCRCGCGARCKSDADCGGVGSCVAFISCC